MLLWGGAHLQVFQGLVGAWDVWGMVLEIYILVLVRGHVVLGVKPRASQMQLKCSAT